MEIQQQFAFYSGSFMEVTKIEVLNIEMLQLLRQLWGKQPFQMFHKISVLKNFPKNHLKTPLLESPFNTVKAYNFIKKGFSTYVFL